jgi:diguanylate cyclase (GGDEF)-like protein
LIELDNKDVGTADLRLSAALLNHLFEHHKGLYIAAISAALLVAAMFTQVIPVWQAVTWVALLAGVEGVRAVMSVRFVNTMIMVSDTDLWAGRFRFGVYASGAAWGSCALLLFPEGQPLFQILTGMVMVSVAAVAAPILAASYRAYLPYSLLLLVPVATRLVLTDTLTSVTAASLIVIALMILNLIARRGHDLSVRFHQQRIDYADQVLELEREISERRAAEDRAQNLTYFDQLTRLPNRARFIEALEATLDRITEDGGRLGVILLNLDRFKSVNDSFGPEAGDLILKRAARRLKEQIEVGGALARLSGRDEFALFFQGDSDHAMQVAERLLVEIARPVTIGTHEIHITGSIGLSVFPRHGEDAETLLRNADIAMYRAKADGRGNLRVFDQTMQSAAKDRLLRENALRKALERQEFVLHFQPLVDTSTQRVNGLEALVRWESPTLGLVMPDEFIPLAEETGLIVPLGEWVLREACHQALTWQNLQEGGVYVSVNLSVAQFATGDLPSTVAKALAETRLPAEQLYLEITESLAMVDRDANIAVLHELRALGVRLALDDFGTGNSSLSHLKHLPVDMLKIDREFCHDLHANGHDAAIARATITLARSLGLDVIAEGVERHEQMRWLATEGCAMMQGFYFAKPSPADEVRQLLGHLTGKLETA